MTKGQADDSALCQRIAREIRERVIAGEFAPGEKLSEQQVAARFSISRNSLREVFRLLTSQGLLAHVPNRGVFVACPGEADVIDIYRARSVIQRGAVEAAVPGHPALDEMERLLLQARQAEQAGDWRQMGTANMEFHRAMVSLADSPRLSNQFDLLLAELRLVFAQLGDGAPLHLPFLSANADLLHALKAGRLKETLRLLDAYLLRSQKAVLARFSRRSL